jgi:NADH-quinone oxidoreductase subunit E
VSGDVRKDGVQSLGSGSGADHGADQPHPEQPTHFEFDAESNAQIEKVIARYPAGKQASAVIPLLYIVQKQMGRQTGSAWVPRVAMDVVAARLGMPPIRVYEVVTFYFMFNTRPIGRYHLQVCGTTPCMLRGSDDVLRACKDAGQLKGYGDSSADGLFTLSEVECVGACVNAPVLVVDDDYYEDLDYDRTVALIEALKRGERPSPGSTIGRQTSAPEGGPLTLLDVPGE